MCHKGGLHIIKFVALIFSAIAALNIGLKAFGYGLIEKIISLVPESMIAHSTLSMVLSYLFGIAGIITLIMIFSHCCSSRHCAPNNN